MFVGHANLDLLLDEVSSRIAILMHAWDNFFCFEYLNVVHKHVRDKQNTRADWRGGAGVHRAARGGAGRGAAHAPPVERLLLVSRIN